MVKMNRLEYYQAGLYIRLSDEDGDKGESNSVTNQRSLLIEFCKSQPDLLICEIYIDDGYSGTNFQRPDFQRMLDDIENKKINCVIVKDLSRFGRDYIDTGHYLERFFPRRGIRFISISDGIDSKKNDYDLMLPIKNIFNEQYARDISKKIRYTIDTKQKAGEFIGAFASYGYKKDPNNKNKLLIDEYAADIVRRIFCLFLEGNGKQTIARILNEDGILSPTLYKNANGLKYRNSNVRHNNITWSYSTISNILSNEIYVGNMVQGRHRQSFGNKAKLTSKADWIVVKNTHDAIIDIDTWNKTQSMLQRRTRKLDLTTNQHIFAGFLRCGDCDYAMCKHYQIKDGEKIYQFMCGNYRKNGVKYCSSHIIDYTVLENIVLNDLKKIIKAIENLDAIVQSSMRINQKKNNYEQRKELEKLIKKYQEITQSMYEDYKEGILSKQEFLLYKGSYNLKIDNLRKQLSFFNNEEIDLKQNEWIEKLRKYKTIEKLDRSIIIEMINVIYIYDDKRVKIVYNFSNELENLFK